MSNFLLEIGTEELPADFARSVVFQFEELVRKDFQQHRLPYERIVSSSTPRRIHLIVNGLADCSDDFIEERKGPPASKAFENGYPTQSAIGFAKRYGLSIDNLQVKETEKGAFVFGKVIEKGESVTDLLVKLIPKWIGSLQGKRFMRWGEGIMRFSRPIRWIVSLLDEKEIPIVLNDVDPIVISSRSSGGHRLYKKDVLITSANDYHNIMQEVGVIANRDDRAALIRDLVHKSSSELNARPDLTKELLDELTDLVESPSLICGEFEKSFLELPSEVLSTVMRVHQRYIPVYVNDALTDSLSLDSKGILTPYFICICNSLPESHELVKAGNERVLQARFADAQFFINADRSYSSSARRDQLKKVTFVEGLGTLFDRVLRIEWLANLFNEKLRSSDLDSNNLKRAAFFSKNDLVSQMVSEFPELQGIIGAKYLLAEGENRDVALAVLEQYLPRGQGDDLPTSYIGSALALIERIELLLSIFLIGQRPSGSSDPYALRRAGNGVLQIIWNQDWRLNLVDLLTRSINHWSNLFPNVKNNSKDLLNDLMDFLHQRIYSLLEESGVDLDLVQAVAGETIENERLLLDPTDVIKRLSLLEKMRKSNKLSETQAVVKRASKLAEQASLPLDVLSASSIVDTNLFEKPSEHSVWNVVNSLEEIINSNSEDRYEKLAEGLASGADALSEFFDGNQSVMVMTDKIPVRTNRLNLLAVLRNQASLIADFNLINF